MALPGVETRISDELTPSRPIAMPSVTVIGGPPSRVIVVEGVFDAGGAVGALVACCGKDGFCVGAPDFGGARLTRRPSILTGVTVQAARVARRSLRFAIVSA